MTEFKPGDVLRYTPYRHHCCESMAIVDEQGRVLDTYWSHDRRVLTPAELETAEVVFNVNDYEQVRTRDKWEAYHPDDRGRITSQHGLEQTLYVRRGATSDLGTQIANAEARIRKAESDLRTAEWFLDCRRDELAKLREAESVAAR